MLKTKTLIFDLSQNSVVDLSEAVEILKNGGLVAFPTETVYGLGADALNVDAVRKVFEIKGRPSDNPLIVHVASLDEAMLFTPEIPENGKKLAEIFWPGPLTLVLKRKEIVPDIVSGGLDTIAIRVPDHPITLELLKKFKSGIVGPSANISGKPSPTVAEHVIQDLGGKIDLVIDTGPTAIGLESTVVDVTITPPKILRIGGLNQEKLREVIGEIKLAQDKELKKRSPGTRYRHYAPNAAVVLISKGNIIHYKQLIKKCREEKKVIGSITHSKLLRDIEPSPLHFVFNSSMEYIAKNLFKALRELDEQGVDVIIVESVEIKGIGEAIMDRLRKTTEPIP